MHFVGQGTDTKQIATEFAERVGEEIVWFPGAYESVRTVQQAFPYEQIFDIPVYRTHIAGQKMQADYGAIIFTSPSNVHGYFMENVPSSKTKLLAIGETTAEAIRQHQYSCTVSEGFSQDELYSSLEALLS